MLYSGNLPNALHSGNGMSSPTLYGGSLYNTLHTFNSLSSNMLYGNGLSNPLLGSTGAIVCISRGYNALFTWRNGYTYNAFNVYHDVFCV